MVKPNTTFNLSLDDMEVIENSLRAAQSNKGSVSSDAKRISEVLGNLHNQKSFFRPRNVAYVGG
jgi:hypothetical protein